MNKGQHFSVKYKPPGHLTPGEFGQRIGGMSPFQVRDRMFRGFIRYKHIGSFYFIPEEEVERFQQMEAMRALPLDVFDYGRGCGPAPEVC